MILLETSRIAKSKIALPSIFKNLSSVSSSENGEDKPTFPEVKLNPRLPSVCSDSAKKCFVSEASIKTPPAPSPNKTELLRSDQSNVFDKVSAPITIPLLYIPDWMNLSAVAKANTKPLHAAVKSIAKALTAPTFA